MIQIKEFFEYIFNVFKVWVIIQPWEKGIRVRFGKNIKKLESGIYFKIPYFDSVYVKECRLKMLQLPIQTLTSKDNQTITINTCLGYSIADIEKLYNTICHPEGTVSNIAMSEVSEFVSKNDLATINVSVLESNILKALNIYDFGIKLEYFKITNFAVVRTFRLIQDGQSWIENGLDLNQKR